MTRFRSVAFISFLAVFLYSCKDEKLDPSQQLYYINYFPLKSGYWIEYDVDSIVHLDTDDAYEIDTAILEYSFQIREEVDTSFIDAENQKAWVIYRYKREHDSLPWNFTNVWTAKITPNAAQKVENNIRFIKLKFPIMPTSTWNGNAFNFFPEEEYSYDDLFSFRQFNGQNFDSTITVIQNDFITLINRIYKREIYAANSGLIFKQLDSVSTKSTPNGFIILKGLEYMQTVTDYQQ